MNSLPIRVKTRFNGKKGNPTKRVYSTPIFDLVTPMEDLSIGFIPPPKHREMFSSEPRPKALPARKPPADFKGLPPTPSINLSRYAKGGRVHHHHQQKRQVSLPPQLLDHQDRELHQIHDYTNIIQIYEENSPFGVLERDGTLLATPKVQPLTADLSSPESQDSGISDSSSNASSSYSFENSQEDDTLSIEPSVLTRLSQESLPKNNTKLHPRDSIRLMRNYSEDHDNFKIQTKTPPILPQHTINVIKKDAYYKSRASFEGEAQNPSIPASPCNERDTSIFTRRSRRLPPVPPKDSDTISRQEVQKQDIPTFQLPGYRGGLRVVNRVPS